MEDDEIIKLFIERSEQGIVELSSKYGRVLMKVAMNALGNVQDAEECVNDAYLGLWRAIPPARPNPLLSYACKVVRNISIDRYNRKDYRRLQTGYEACLDDLEGVLVSDDNVEDMINEKQLASYIDCFLNQRNETDQLVFVRRFFFMDSCKDIAIITGFSNAAIRKRLQRIKADLKRFLEEREVIV